MSLELLEPIDREVVEPTLGPHAALIDTLDRQRRNLLAGGGVLCLGAAGASPWLLARALPLSAFQVALAATISLLAALTLLRPVAHAQRLRLRLRFTDHCQRAGVDLPATLGAVARAHGQWHFFKSLWTPDDGLQTPPRGGTGAA